MKISVYSVLNRDNLNFENVIRSSLLSIYRNFNDRENCFRFVCFIE